MKPNAIAALAVCLTACSAPIVPPVPLPGTTPTMPEPIVHAAIPTGAFDLVSEIPVMPAATGSLGLIEADDFHSDVPHSSDSSTPPTAPARDSAPLVIAEWVATILATDPWPSSSLGDFLSSGLATEMTLASGSLSSRSDSATVIASAIETAGRVAHATVTIDLDSGVDSGSRRLRFYLDLVETSSGWQVVDVRMAR